MNDFSHETYGDVLIVALNDEQADENAPSQEEELTAAMEKACNVAIDLSDVDDVTDDEFRMLLRFYHLASAKGGAAALVGAGGEIRDTIEATGLSEFFIMCDALDDALPQLCRDSAGHASLR